LTVVVKFDTRELYGEVTASRKIVIRRRGAT